MLQAEEHLGNAARHECERVEWVRPCEILAHRARTHWRKAPPAQRAAEERKIRKHIGAREERDDAELVVEGGGHDVVRNAKERVRMVHEQIILGRREILRFEHNLSTKV